MRTTEQLALFERDEIRPSQTTAQRVYKQYALFDERPYVRPFSGLPLSAPESNERVRAEIIGQYLLDFPLIKDGVYAPMDNPEVLDAIYYLGSENDGCLVVGKAADGWDKLHFMKDPSHGYIPLPSEVLPIVCRRNLREKYEIHKQLGHTTLAG